MNEMDLMGNYTSKYIWAVLYCSVLVQINTKLFMVMKISASNFLQPEGCSSNHSALGEKQRSAWFKYRFGYLLNNCIESTSNDEIIANQTISENKVEVSLGLLLTKHLHQLSASKYQHVDNLCIYNWYEC